MTEQEIALLHSVVLPQWQGPTHEHDCTSCTYLGHRKGADLYHCGQGGFIPTVIARYSSEGPEYSSGLYGLDEPVEAYTGCQADRKVAKLLAASRGLNVTPH